MKSTLFKFVFFWCWFIILNSAFSQTWTPTSAPTNAWVALACSADGNILIATTGAHCFTSTNSGISWISNNVSIFGEILGASANGQQVVSAITAGDNRYLNINESTNNGLTWSLAASFTNDTSGPVNHAVLSANGQNQAITFEGPQVFTSTNFGKAWNLSFQLPEFNPEQAQGAAISADGRTLIVMNGRNVCTTTNFGGSWITNNSPQPGDYRLAASADGRKILAATMTGGQAYISTNLGVTWALITNVPTPPWSSTASSADGTKLVMVTLDYNGIERWIYTSQDAGVDWVSNNAPPLLWEAVASSADGSKRFAAAYNGGIWALQTTVSPQLNLAPSKTNLALSWVIPTTNLVLQQSTDLVLWTDMTNIPAFNLTNLQNQVALWPTDSIDFFRLISE